jgi:hypothetical protein
MFTGERGRGGGKGVEKGGSGKGFSLFRSSHAKKGHAEKDG